MDISKSFGARVRELRRERNMTQMELADKIGIRGSYVSDLESARKEPCLRVIKSLADGFGISLRRLFWDM
jgi:hypothetical protein